MSSQFSPQTFSPCRNQYKCGAFFMDLQGQNETMRWIGALPDMLHKDTVEGIQAFLDKRTPDWPQ